MRDGKNVILCVDDDPDIRASLRVILEANGYLFEEAGSAEEGVKVYRRVAPDLILLDLMMEEVDAGTQFVMELKALGKTPPIYMLSSTGDALSQVTDVSRLGLAGAFQKPLDSGTLLTLLRDKLG